MIYIIGGPGKSGTTSIAQQVATDLGYRKVNAGGYMREQAMIRGITFPGYDIPQDPNMWDYDSVDIATYRDYAKAIGYNIDAPVDRYSVKQLVSAIRNNESIVIESKALARLLNSEAIHGILNQVQSDFPIESRFTIEDIRQVDLIRAIWLHADLESRATRSLGKSGITFSPEAWVDGLPPIELSNEMDALLKRQSKDGHDFAKLYGMYDYPVTDVAPNANFGHVIDSSQLTKDQTLRQVAEYLATSDVNVVQGYIGS
jgi:cytidylate kinase